MRRRFVVHLVMPGRRADMKERRVRAVLVVLVLCLLTSGCGNSKSGITSDTASQQNLQRDCANDKWKEQNLGLWYSLCRQPLHW